MSLPPNENARDSFVYFEKIIRELQLYILQFLSIEDLANVSRASKYLKSLTEDNFIWKRKILENLDVEMDNKMINWKNPSLKEGKGIIDGSRFSTEDHNKLFRIEGPIIRSVFSNKSLSKHRNIKQWEDCLQFSHKTWFWKLENW